MRHLMSSAVLAAALLTNGVVHAGRQTVTLAVENMTCASCPYIVRKAMASVPGVAKVDVSYERKSAIVTFDDAKTTVDAVAQASADAGYPARPVGLGR